MWNWVKTIVDSVFGTKAQDASTQTDGQQESRKDLRASGSAASVKSETSSQLSGASTVRTLFGSFSRKPTKVPGDDNGTKVEEWLNDVKTFNQDKKDDITQKANEEKIKIQKELIRQEEEYRQAQMEAESNRASMDREAQKNAHSQATAIAGQEAYAARILASAIQIANPNKLGLNIAPIAIAPEPEGSEGRIVPKKPPQKEVRFNPEEKKTWNGPKAKKRSTQTSKKVPKNQGGENAQTQDPRTDWEKERDEFMKKADAGAVARARTIEASKKITQQAKEEFWSSHDAFGFENLDLQTKNLEEYAKAKDLSQKELEALIKRMGEENGLLGYDKVKTSRDGSRNDVKTHSSKVGNHPHLGGHAGLKRYNQELPPRTR